MYREAIILCGGKGTRLQSVVDDRPKSMALINGVPFLEYQLNYLDFWGIKHVVLAVGYKRNIIQDYFGDMHKSLKISYSVEEKPLGTGGAIRKAFSLVNDFGAMIYNGDTMFRLNIEKFQMFNRQKMSNFSMALTEVDDASRYGKVLLNEDKRVIGFAEKGDGLGAGYINGGVYYIRKDYFLKQELPDKFSLEKDFIESKFDEIDIYAMICKQYFLDIGIPEDYQKAQDEFKEFQY